MKTKFAATALESRPINELREHPRNREIFIPLGDADLQLLADDMDVHGLREPLNVTYDGTIIDGHRRLRAARLNGWKHVDCLVHWDWLDPFAPEVIERLILDNLDSRVCTPEELAQAAEAWIDIYQHCLKGPLQTELRETIVQRPSMSGQELSRFLQLLRLPPALRNAVDQGFIPAEFIGKVTALPRDTHWEIADDLARGEPVMKVVDWHLTMSRTDFSGASEAAVRFHDAAQKFEAACDGLVANWPISNRIRRPDRDRLEEVLRTLRSMLDRPRRHDRTTL